MSERDWGVNEPYIMLTRRQYEVVKLLARGLTQAEAAKELGIDRRTVEGHLEALSEAMHRKSTAHLFYGLGLAAGRDLPVRFAHEPEPRP